MSTSSPPAPVMSTSSSPFVFPTAMAEKAIRMIILNHEYETTTVLSCRERRSDRAPVPPMGAAVHFSRPDPYTMDVTVRKVERLESADHTIVHLQALSPPPPLLRISDMVILETIDPLHHWKGYIRHYEDSMFFRDFGEECSPNVDGTVLVSIYVPDQVPLLMGIAFQPATKSPCGSGITRRKADVKQADKKSTQSEGVPLLMSITVQPAPKSPCGSEIARKKAEVKHADEKSSQSEGDALQLNEASASENSRAHEEKGCGSRYWDFHEVPANVEGINPPGFFSPHPIWEGFAVPVQRAGKMAYFCIYCNKVMSGRATSAVNHMLKGSGCKITYEAKAELSVRLECFEERRSERQRNRQR